MLLLAQRSPLRRMLGPKKGQQYTRRTKRFLRYLIAVTGLLFLWQFSVPDVVVGRTISVIINSVSVVSLVRAEVEPINIPKNIPVHTLNINGQVSCASQKFVGFCLSQQSLLYRIYHFYDRQLDYRAGSNDSSLLDSLMNILIVEINRFRILKDFYDKLGKVYFYLSFPSILKLDIAFERDFLCTHIRKERAMLHPSPLIYTKISVAIAPHAISDDCIGNPRQQGNHFKGANIPRGGFISTGTGFILAFWGWINLRGRTRSVTHFWTFLAGSVFSAYGLVIVLPWSIH